jgi:dUTP pyrophosphatase
VLLIKVEKLPHYGDLPLPAYQTEGAAGMDLLAAIPKEDIIRLDPGQRLTIPSGIKVQIPPGYEAQIRSRSGLGINKGIVITHGIGTIDADYRGEIGIAVHNISNDTFYIGRGDRLAQMVFNKVEHATLMVGVLDNTIRGRRGYGSTGL